MPRVIAGTARRLRLETPKGLATRPTADQTKETLFNVLQARRSCFGLRVLELFAGSGQLSIEALSRGANSAILVDQSVRVRQVQKKNLEHTKLLDRAELWTCSAQSAVRSLAQRGETFDLILLDPPYAEVPALWSNMAQTLCGLLAEDGILVLEYGTGTVLPEVVTGLELLKSCCCGAAVLSFYATGAHSGSGAEVPCVEQRE